MEAYLESGQNLDPQQLHEAFEKALRERHLIPVVFVSAETGAGVDALLDYIVKLLPSPREANPPPFMRGEGDGGGARGARLGTGPHVVAHVFKVVVDPYVGRTAILRVHQGTIKSGAQLFVGDSRKPDQAQPPLQAAGQAEHRGQFGRPGRHRRGDAHRQPEFQRRAARLSRRGQLPCPPAGDGAAHDGHRDPAGAARQ
jgi:translation elongation factor EF-G